MSYTHHTELRVRYAETDQMGVVYHANYLAWCEVGRTEYIRAAGMSYRDLEATGVALAVSDVSMRFHAAASYDDVVRVETRLADVRSRTLTFEYSVVNAGTGVRLVTATTRLISIDAAGGTIALPRHVRGFLERARGSDVATMASLAAERT